MSDNLKNNFEELIRNKLDDYSIPVNTNNWEAIEKFLGRSRRVKYLYFASGIVAAAVALFLLIPNPDNNSNSVVNNNPEQITKTPVTDLDKTKPVNKSVDKNIPTQPVPDVAEKQETKPCTLVAAIETNPVNAYVAALEYAFITPGLNIKMANMPEIKKLHTKRNIYLQEDDVDIALPENIRKSTNKNWIASAGFSAGSYQDINAKGSEMLAASPLLTLDNSKEYIKNKYRNEISVPDNAEPAHSMPLSFRLSVNKKLNSRWAIESGINYTYLTTKYKWNGGDARQQLHYLGIPVNIVLNVVSKPSWDVYISAGGMVEKGIYGAIKNKNKLTKISMPGLQWSVNGAIGVNYKIYRNLGLFLEPQFGYFFNSKQPESIRTEWPISIGVGAGLRFKL